MRVWAYGLYLLYNGDAADVTSTLLGPMLKSSSNWMRAAAVGPESRLEKKQSTDDDEMESIYDMYYAARSAKAWKWCRPTT